MNSVELAQIAEKIVAERGCVALTGAGVSTESGIPDFRSPGGLWTRFDPMEYATIEAFQEDPQKVWKMLREMDGLIDDAQPNPAHQGLARLEELGVLQGLITQNIDNLHQEAGSQVVIEFHGNGQNLVCLDCRTYTDASAARLRWAEEFPPLCSVCRTVLKPDVVLFGEAISARVSSEAMQLAQQATVLLVVGTSATVAPASYIPAVAKKMGALVAVFDLEPTVLSDGLADHTLLGKAGETIPALVREVEALIPGPIT